jgi:hypothetical protein
VLNYAKENGKNITDTQKKAAKEFVEDQKEMSSGLELEDDGK